MGVQAAYSSNTATISLQDITTAIGAATGTAKNMQGARQVTWDIVMSGTIASGTAVVECLPNVLNPSTYAGTWHELDSVDLSTLTGGKVYHGTYPGNVDWIRIRIPAGTPIVGGGQMDYGLINGLRG